MRSPLALLAALAFLAAPAVHAQVADDFTLTVGKTSAPIPYNGTADLPVTLTVGCALLLQNVSPGETGAEATFTLTNPPAWASLATPVTTFTFSPQDCVTVPPTASTGTITAQGTLKLQVTAKAPGLVPQTLNVTATMGEESATQQAVVNVTYHAAHTITPSITFPYTVTSPTATFDLLVTMDANARSMVMFTNIQTTTGTVEGFASEVYEPPAKKTFKITFKAPPGHWEEAHVKFHNYSHVLLKETGKDGPAMLEKDYDWTFVNGMPHDDSSTDGTQSSPAMGLIVGVAILGAALIARRRN